MQSDTIGIELWWWDIDSSSYNIYELNYLCKVKALQQGIKGREVGKGNYANSIYSIFNEKLSNEGHGQVLRGYESASDGFAYSCIKNYLSSKEGIIEIMSAAYKHE
ncbi:unnamed protein product [Strongylus vulgaris]|uniref:Uncharacterized protein n=1 Tax=Strongylus vulgaris TaxID=40348 RepID=A0A3P7IGL0_STRVU|nr:unnamed protein product [Strongylus vulgaris]